MCDRFGTQRLKCGLATWLCNSPPPLPALGALRGSLCSWEKQPQRGASCAPSVRHLATTVAATVPKLSPSWIFPPTHSLSLSCLCFSVCVLCFTDTLSSSLNIYLLHSLLFSVCLSACLSLSLSRARSQPGGHTHLVLLQTTATLAFSSPFWLKSLLYLSCKRKHDNDRFPPHYTYHTKCPLSFIMSQTKQPLGKEAYIKPAYFDEKNNCCCNCVMMMMMMVIWYVMSYLNIDMMAIVSKANDYCC